MFVFWLALNAYSLFHGSVSTQTTIYCTEAGICSTSGWFHGLFVSRSTLPSCGLRMKARSITTVGGKLDVGEMFTIFWEYLVYFFWFSRSKLICFKFFLSYLSYGSFVGFRVCHGMIAQLRTRKSTHLNLNFCIFILCQVSYFGSSVKSVWGKHCWWVFEN